VAQPNPETKRRKRQRPEPPQHPRCPEWLSEGAQEVWKRTVGLMREMSLLTRADANVLARYCETFVQWRDAVKFLEKFGTTYPCKSGTGIVKCFMPFPQVSIAQKLSAQLTKLERELGLTPAARDKLATVNLYFDRPGAWERDQQMYKRLGADGILG
jgi:P27 family predicted phage terminase small subunit